MALFEACCAWTWENWKNHFCASNEDCFAEIFCSCSSNTERKRIFIDIPQVYFHFLQNLTDIVSTVGVDCETFNIAGGEVTVWDFAGQLEYTVTHQFFLSSEVSK